RRRHTRFSRDWSSDVCSSDLQAIGKNVVAMKLMVFAIAASLASVAGWLYAHYFTFVSAEGFTVELTIYMLAMVIIGGTGNIFGRSEERRVGNDGRYEMMSSAE